MENREQQILSEIKSMMASIRSQIELLDAKMAELQQVVDPEDVDALPIDLDIDLLEPVHEDFPEVELAFEPEPEVVEPEPEPVVEVVVEDLPEPELLLEPEVVVEQPVQAVIDTMTAKHPWRTDMPGTPVKDIRSAISLNDRIIFINYLFNEDPMAFQNSLTKINTMASLDEVLQYVSQEHPEWNLESEVVYRFMMAVRRRIR